jgi:signal transduction histidine kinase
MKLGASVRIRLTLWNVGILALVLGGFGSALCLSVQVQQQDAIERDLDARARLAMHPAEAELITARAVERPAMPRSMKIEELDYRRALTFDLAGRSQQFRDDRPWDPAAYRIASRGRRWVTTVRHQDDRLLVLSAPIRRKGALVGVVQVAQPLVERERLVESQFRTLLVLVPLALLVAGVGGLFLTNNALRPVDQMTQAAADIGAGDLSRRLEVRGQDELARLALTFNSMIARLEGTFRGLESAYYRLEGAYEEQQRFTGEASHELRTPLTRIKGMTSLALSGPGCFDEYRDAVLVADQAADMMTRIVQDLLLLARSDAGQLTPYLAPISVCALLRRAADRPAAPGDPVILLRLPEGDLQVAGDTDHLTRLLTNLVENAVRHTPAAGEVTLSARQDGAQVLITVTDTGEGIPAEHLPHVCQRFYRVDSARARRDGGSGLGLAICQSIVQAHNGTMSIDSTAGQGTTVRILLPLANAA